MDTASPQCIGFIMDGNRRWAVREEKQVFEGHLEGYATLKKMIRSVHRAGIPHMVCYAFSTENWNRTETEVSFLTDLLRKAVLELKKETETETEGINYRFVGQLDRFPNDLQIALKELEESNHAEPALTVWILLSYGGRAEIVSAVQGLLEKGLQEVTEEEVALHLWTAGMPDPDMIIRTSGEKRISNFLLWQSAYSEFFFTETLWPDFGEAEFRSMVEQYGERKRRKGC